MGEYDHVHFHKPYEGCYDDCPEPHFTDAEARWNDLVREVREYEAAGYAVAWGMDGIRSLHKLEP